MKFDFASAIAVLFALYVSASASAQIVDLTPTDIHGDDTNTASFTDAFLTLTPFIGTTQDTFNGNGARLGIDDAGTNNNAFNDPDTDPFNGNEERLVFDFAADAGLTRISYDFSRADGDGPNDGVVISGFLSDPGVTFTFSDDGSDVGDGNLFAVFDSGAGNVRLNIPGQLFNGNDIDINFDAAASNGQTLSLSVTDSTQAGAQLAILGIGYDSNIVAVPEPTSVTCLAIVGLAAFSRRRRK
jgi:hypothetical protein